MDTITRSIDVDVPLQTAYDQWTQFEEFPRFMGGVESVTQNDDTHTHWVVKIGGVTREFDAEVVAQKPDEGVSWRSLDGTTHTGRVTFEPQGDTRTRVTLAVEWAPEGLAEKVADALGIVEHRAEKDLEAFKELIEKRGTETGAWRGEVSSEGASRL